MNSRVSTLERMLALEALIREQPDHALFENDKLDQGSPNAVWRDKVVQWCYDVVDHVQESRSMVYVAFSILDRYCSVLLQRDQHLNANKYAIATMTALFLASRISGRGSLSIQDLVVMSHGGIMSHDFVKVGNSMLEELTWDHRLLTPIDFVRVYFELVPGIPSETDKQPLLDSASYLTDLAVFDTTLSKHKASDVALAAIINTLQTSQLHSFMHNILPVTTLSPYSRIIDAVRSRLEDVYRQSIHRGPLSPHVVTEDEDADPVELIYEHPAVIRTVSDSSLVNTSGVSETKRIPIDEPEEGCNPSKRLRYSPSGSA